MALNKNHEFEEVNGIKCGIVEKNISAERVNFLKTILEQNGYEVIIAASPPPKAAATAAATDEAIEPALIKPAETFTIGVTDYTFNATNALFGRLLKTKEGEVVTMAYWQQQSAHNEDEIPYFANKESWR
jgi:hypothetical protein